MTTCPGCAEDLYANRSEHDYDCLLPNVFITSTFQDMTTQTATQTVTGWKHEDNTLCAHPELCGKTRSLFFFGGRPEHPDTLGE